MTPLKKIFYLGAGAIVAAGVFAIPTLWLKPWYPSHFYVRLLQTVAESDPLWATEVGLQEAFPWHHFARKVAGPPVDFEHQLEIIDGYDPEGMPPRERRELESVKWWIEKRAIRERKFTDYLSRISPSRSPAVRGPTALLLPIRSDAEAEERLARALALGHAVAKEAQHIRAFAKHPVPARVRNAFVDRIRPYALAPDENALAKQFAEALDSCPACTRQKDHRAQLDAHLRTIIVPAYGQLVAAASTAEVTDEAPGVQRLPEGKAFYKNETELFTGTRLDPETIHEMASKSLAAQRKAAKVELERLGLSGGRVPENVRMLREDGMQSVRTSSVTALVNEFEGRDPLAALTPTIAIIDRASIEPVRYRPSSLDGSRGAELITGSAASLPAGILFAEVRHVLGHHAQATGASESPMALRYLSQPGFEEGFAHYFEYLALHDQQTAPIDRLAVISRQMKAAGLAVIDTGIHAKGWSTESARRFLLERTHLTVEEVDEALVQILDNPAAALSSLVGANAFATRAGSGPIDAQTISSVLAEGPAPFHLLTPPP